MTCRECFNTRFFSVSAMGALSWEGAANCETIGTTCAESSLSLGSLVAWASGMQIDLLIAGHTWAKLRVHSAVRQANSKSRDCARSHHDGGYRSRARIRTLMQRNLSACAHVLIYGSCAVKQKHHRRERTCCSHTSFVMSCAAPRPNPSA